MSDPSNDKNAKSDQFDIFLRDVGVNVVANLVAAGVVYLIAAAAGLVSSTLVIFTIGFIVSAAGIYVERRKSLLGMATMCVGVIIGLVGCVRLGMTWEDFLTQLQIAF
jgi:hypothetical protein